MNKLSLAIIVKADDSEVEGLDRLLETTKKYVDEICVTITGKNNNIKKICEEHGAKISYFEWIHDFSAARTYNFSQCTGDWILWLDSDDTIRGGEKLRGIINHAEQNNISGFMFQYEYKKDENGNVVDIHWKTQLMKNDGHFEWKGKIHEDPLQVRGVRWQKATDVVREHHSNEERGIESVNRNLEILLIERGEQGSKPDPRTLFYLGRTYIALGDFNKAVAVLDEYLSLSGWDDERYEAQLLIGQCYTQSDRLDDAILVYNAAITEKENNSDAYINKAMTYLKMGEYKNALVNYKIASTMPSPDMNTYHNPMLYTRDVYAGAAICYMNIGEVNTALDSINKALTFDKNSEYLSEIRTLILKLKNKNDSVSLFYDAARFLAKSGNEAKIKPLMQAVPFEISDDPRLVAFQNNFNEPKEWDDDSVVIFCGTSVENWDGDSVNNGGIGGSETAVIEIAKRLNKKVTVYNQSNAPVGGNEIDGVDYRNYWEFNINDRFNTLWVWRMPEFFDSNIHAKFTILDLHDVMNPGDFTEERLAKIDKIFVKTKYHRSLLPDIDDDKFEIIGNGIDLKRFEGEKSKESFRFVYSSTPDRGLDVLLEYIWDDIKKEFKNAELHVYYGWKTFHELQKHNPERMAWMKKVQKLMEKPGVINHGRVGQKELADDLLKTSYWLYPTEFPEIHCITACEMQAAGVVPITSGYAALEETQKFGPKVYGDIHDPEWQKEYLKTVIETVKSSNKIEDSIEIAKQFSWDIVADEWNKKIDKQIEEKEISD